MMKRWQRTDCRFGCRTDWQSVRVFRDGLPIRPTSSRLILGQRFAALILNIGLAAVLCSHAAGQYGPELPITASLGLGPSMDAAVVDQTLYVIGDGKLHVADISNPASPRIVGGLDGLGNTRQIEVHRGAAYVTAREDGLFIIDVSRPATPVLLNHYDAIELATGIALSGDLAFVACRTAGVELVDISQPARPVHLSTIRMGEAQSVAARNGFLYAGVWGSREVVICDVRNPRQPTIVARAPLDGNGDGVALRGDYCFAATGHHARGWRPKDAEASPFYGRGHGLEIFDIRNPAAPVFVSRVKMPRFYRIGMDMWDVIVAGDYAFVADTYNGVFVVDISDLKKPRFVGHRQLPSVPAETIDGVSTSTERLPGTERLQTVFAADGVAAGERLPSPVGGIALAKDTLYVAGASTDLHVVAAPAVAQPPQQEPDQEVKIPPPQPSERDPRFRIYRPEGQVWGVAFSGDTRWSPPVRRVCTACSSGPRSRGYTSSRPADSPAMWRFSANTPMWPRPAAAFPSGNSKAMGC